MVDSQTVSTVANQAHGLVTAIQVAVLAIVGVVAYIMGIFKGKKKVETDVPAEKTE